MSISNGRGPVRHLSQREIETRGPGLHHDGDGLYLAVSDTRRRWVFRYTHPTLTNPKRPTERKRVEMGMGTPWIDKVNPGGIRPSAVREEVRKAHELLAQGTDPLAERDRKKAEERAEAAKAPPMTFGAYAKKWMDAKLGEHKNPKHRAQWRMTMEEYAKPIWNKPIAAITTDDVKACLLQPVERRGRTLPLWEAVPETARRTQGRIEKLLDAATQDKHRSGDNPARWRTGLKLSSDLKAHPARKRHYPALPYERAPTVLAALRQCEGIAARALEFAILAASRSGEVRGMTWAELDADRAVWTIPASRMKAGREHRVPLTDRARAILADMDMLRAKERPDTGLVFPGQKNKRSKLDNPPLSDMTLTAVLKRLREGEGDDADARRKLLRDAQGNDVVVHGFRSTFRDWAEDKARFPARVVEHALAHTIKDKAEAAYRRGDALEQRVELMAAWAAYLGSAEQAGNGADIITLHPKRA